MKIRIKGNSIRLRLQRGEVAALHETGSVHETLTLGPEPDAPFHYGIEVIPGDVTAVRHQHGTLTVCLPVAWAKALALTDRAGFDAEVATAPGVLVRVLVEKDFPCPGERPGEDDSDAFAPPAEGACPPSTDAGRAAP